MIFNEQITKILDALRSDPDFTDKATYVDLLEEPLLEGPHDLNHAAFWLSRNRASTVALSKSAASLNGYFATAPFRLLGVFSTSYNRERVTRWALSKLTVTCANNTTITSYLDNAELIYEEETGDTLKWQVEMIRISFNLTIYFQSDICEIDICETEPCLEDANLY